MASPEPTTPRAPHSAYWLTQEFRNYWWDRDHLALISSRLGLEHARRVLDVGCGMGHWTFLLASVLHPETRFHGIDLEPKWIEQASSRAAEFGLTERVSFARGDAGNLPFDDQSFDLVTCQTLLMHLNDPRRVIREMVRATRSGGTMLASEPNNLVSHVMGTSVSAEASVEEVLDDVRFGLMRERGKAALGEGNDSIGNLIPGYFADAGLTDVATVLSEKTPTVYPPYDSDEQQVLITHALDAETWIGDREACRRYFEAAGASEAEFEQAWERRVEDHRRVAAAIAEQTFHTSGGFLLYLTSGRRP